MYQLRRYNLKSFHLSNFINSHSWLSIFSSNSLSKPEFESVPIHGVVKQPVNCSIFQSYDVVVVGGGHAGCEGKQLRIQVIFHYIILDLAAHASARMGARTLLVRKKKY